MNLNSKVQENDGWFWTVFGVSMAMGAAIIAGIVGWIRHRRLMFIPSTL